VRTCCIGKCIINNSIKFILEDMTDINHKEYKKSRKQRIKKCYRHSNEQCFGTC